MNRFGNPRILPTIGMLPSGPHMAFNHSKDELNCLVDHWHMCRVGSAMVVDHKKGDLPGSVDH